MSAYPFYFTSFCSATLAAVIGSTCLAAPLTLARAEPPLMMRAQATPSKVPAVAGDKSETIEQRIANLHAALKITPAEEASWSTVAQAMRGNAIAMEKLVVAKRTSGSKAMTAVDDLKTYQEFAQAHLDSLKTLIPAFQTLYDAMPEAQKKEADQVFEKFGRNRADSPGQPG